MLTITRKRGESVWIGSSKVTVVRSGSRVQLCIDAPDHITIMRDELLSDAPDGVSVDPVQLTIEGED